MNKFYVYIVQSDKDHTYIGQTKDLVDRLKRHNSNRSKFTAHKGNLKISIVHSRSQATNLEKKLKSFKNSEKAIQHLQKISLEHLDSSRRRQLKEFNKSSTRILVYWLL